MLKIDFIGYLGNDCNVKHVDGHVAITFSVGVTRQYKNRQNVVVKDTTWIGCTLWRKPENTRIAEFLKKGLQVYVSGMPSVRAWTKPDGSAGSSLDCRVLDLEMLGKSQNPSLADTPQPTAINATQPTAESENDDLPF